MNWGALLISIGMIAVGLHLWRLAWRYSQLRRAMGRWPCVPAKVLGYRTVVESNSSKVDVRLRYSYGDQEFRIWTASPTRSGYGREDAGQAEKQVAARFPRNTVHSVFVNPTVPEEAFLELPEAHMLAMLVAGGMVLIALSIAVLAADLLDIDQELVTLGFMLVLGVALALVAVFTAFAFWSSWRRSTRRRSQ